MQDYASLYAQSVDDVESFWLDAAQHISWDTPPKTGLDRSDPPFYRWFPDGRLNTCFNAVDRHVLAGRGDQNAIIYDSPCLLYTSPSPRDKRQSRMPSSA